jgi:hypothetical protein
MRFHFYLFIIAGWFYGTTFAFNEKIKSKISIFMASDNDLYPYAKKDLKEISNYFLENENNIYLRLAFERPNKSYITTNTTLDHLRLKLIEREENISSRLFSLLEDHQDYLILWGHGEGYLGNNNQDVSGGILFEGENENPLSMTDLKKILKIKKVDTLIFDSCLMQTVEVISELMNVTKTIIGSAQTQDYFGLPYKDVFTLINNKASVTNEIEFIKKLTKTIANGYENKHFTISAINTHEFKYQVLPALKKLLALLDLYFTNNPFDGFLLKQFIDEAPKYYGDRIDMGELLAILEYFLREQEIGSRKIKLAIQNLRQAFRQSMITSTFGEDIFQDYARESFYGISVWLPKYEQTYRLRESEMKESELYKQLLPQTLETLFGF